MMTPLGRGLLTGMSMGNEGDVTSAMAQMIETASKTELAEALLDVTALATALSRVFGQFVDLDGHQVLERLISG